MATALLTGSKLRTSRLVGSLRIREPDLVVADSRVGLAALTGRLPERSVGAYVQLLMDADATDAWAPPVTERIETMALVAPLLAPNAAVVILADDPADPAHDQRVADGLRLLAEAALSRADHCGATVIVLQEGTPEAITSVLHRTAQPGLIAPLADIGADRPYADWRTDILNLTSSPDVTYFGWVSQDGTPKVGLLRGAVLSPLAVPEASALAWGTTEEPGAVALGRALLTATLGGTTVDDGLVELFVKDIVGSLPAGGFELSAAEVQRWLRRQCGQTPIA